MRGCRKNDCLEGKARGDAHGEEEQADQLLDVRSSVHSRDDQNHLADRRQQIVQTSKSHKITTGLWQFYSSTKPQAYKKL